jgi:predicted nucleic acid-binding protein
MLYLDTSALVKLVRVEQETAAFEQWLQERPAVPWVASALVEIELPRAIRVADPAALIHVPGVLATIDLLKIDSTVRINAAEIDPPAVRSLDAIHLATALELAADLEALVTYDKRLGEAAQSAGLTWAAPTA